MTETGIVLVTGATGYVGGRLVPRLLAAGYRVRLLVRDPARLQGRAWTTQVDVVRGDVLHPTTLPAALAGVEVAYYFIHSLARHLPVPGAGPDCCPELRPGGAPRRCAAHHLSGWSG